MPDGITHTVMYTEELVNSTDSKARGNHGQPHQSHMMRFSGRQQFNNQPRRFVQQNRHFNSRPETKVTREQR
ncbi:hypothetical protein TNCV_1063421 [Trichonephila clavipes]|nr:hypothetical protein TNCV_1063421 [Trichonephila clavipes]